MVNGEHDKYPGHTPSINSVDPSPTKGRNRCECGINQYSGDMHTARRDICKYGRVALDGYWRQDADYHRLMIWLSCFNQRRPSGVANRDA